MNAKSLLVGCVMGGCLFVCIFVQQMKTQNQRDREQQSYMIETDRRMAELDAEIARIKTPEQLDAAYEKVLRGLREAYRDEARERARGR